MLQGQQLIYRIFQNATYMYMDVTYLRDISEYTGCPEFYLYETAAQGVQKCNIYTGCPRILYLE